MSLLDDLDVIKNTTKEEEEEKPKAYVSQSGFVKVPLLRGFTEIEKLYYFVVPIGAVICGGYARYCASPRLDNLSPAGDVDIYCPTDEVFKTLSKEFKKHLTVRYENNMAITYTRTDTGEFAYCPIVQLIKPVKEGKVVAVGKMQDILENFDFTVIRAAIINPRECLVDADFLHDEGKKILRLKNIHCPVSSTLRCMKYSGKGYWLPPTQALTLFMDWDKRDDEYKIKIIEYVEKANKGEGLTQEQVDELEELMRID